MPVVTTADAAAYRVALPLVIYRDTVREDLADIRVFNARGEVVPYALSRPPARTQTRGPGTALPLFALQGDSPAAANAGACDHRFTGWRRQTADPGAPLVGRPALSVNTSWMDGR